MITSATNRSDSNRTDRIGNDMAGDAAGIAVAGATATDATVAGAAATGVTVAGDSATGAATEAVTTGVACGVTVFSGTVPVTMMPADLPGCSTVASTGVFVTFSQRLGFPGVRLVQLLFQNRTGGGLGRVVGGLNGNATGNQDDAQSQRNSVFHEIVHLHQLLRASPRPIQSVMGRKCKAVSSSVQPATCDVVESEIFLILEKAYHRYPNLCECPNNVHRKKNAPEVKRQRLQQNDRLSNQAVPKPPPSRSFAWFREPPGNRVRIRTERS